MFRYLSCRRGVEQSAEASPQESRSTDNPDSSTRSIIENIARETSKDPESRRTVIHAAKESRKTPLRSSDIRTSYQASRIETGRAGKSAKLTELCQDCTHAIASCGSRDGISCGSQALHFGQRACRGRQRSARQREQRNRTGMVDGKVDGRLRGPGRGQSDSELANVPTSAKPHIECWLILVQQAEHA